MNYIKHYKHLIRMARKRQVNNDVYKEKHHIIPKCLLKHKPKQITNGKWNLVELTAREHFIAHKLLWKHSRKTKGPHHIVTKQMLCAWAMFFKKSGDRKFINSHSYESLRTAYSKSVSGSGNPMFGKVGSNKGKIGVLNPLFGRKRPEHSKLMTGRKHDYPCYWTGKVGPNKGKKTSEETKNKQSLALSGIPRSEEIKNKISSSHKGKLKTKEHKASLSKAKMGVALLKKRKKYLINYDNNTSETIIGIKEFCKNNGHNYSSIFKLINGDIPFYKNIIGATLLKGA